MVKGINDTVTLTIKEIRNIFTAGSDFGEHTLKEDMDLYDEDEDITERPQDFGEFLNVNHAIELI